MSETAAETTSSTRPRLGILLSGRGSNFLAIHRAVDEGRLAADIALVLSNVEDAPGLAKARQLALPAVALPHAGLKRRQHDAQVVEALVSAAVDWVCLAGYMRILGPAVLDAFSRRILNVHPSLLPAFPGLHAQQQAWDYGVELSGCTVHLVDRGLDTGPIVSQAAVSVRACRSADELAANILRQEHRVYPEALARLLSEEWEVQGRRVVFRRDPAGGPCEE